MTRCIWKFKCRYLNNNYLSDNVSITIILTTSLSQSLSSGTFLMGRNSSPKNLSVTVILAAAIGGLMAIMLIIVQLIHFTANEKNTAELLVDQARSITTDIELGIRHQLDSTEQILASVSTEMVEAEGLISDSRLEDLFSGALLSHGRMGSLNFFNMDYRPYGMVINDKGRPEVSPIANHKHLARENPDIQRIINVCRQEEGAVWHQPEFFQTESFLVATHPVFHQDKYMGCLAATIEVRSLSALMERLGERFEATLFILRGEERVLAHKTLTDTHHKQNTDTPLVHLNEIDDSVLQQIWQTEQVHEEFSVLAEEGIHVHLTRNDDEKPYLFLTKELINYGDEILTVGAWFPWETFSTQIMRLFWSFISGVVLLIVGVALAVLMGKRIAKPIKETAQAAAKISHLSLDDVEPLPGSRFSELNDQAMAFNSMLTGLKAFGHYVPSKLVDRLIQEDVALSEVSQERELTVIFTDIAGFTSQSEQLPASDVADFLNHHFELLGSAVDAENGTIDKYIGDALMAFWGAPERMDDAPIRACRAALAINRALEIDNQHRVKQGLEPVQIRIGVHTGSVVVGNIGSQGRINYTIVGDTVNASQRLESTGREFALPDAAATILISEETRQQLKEQFVTEALGEVKVKGRDKAMVVYRLISERS